MGYQNNNNRINPEAKEDRALKPSVSVVDKTIHYSPTYNQGEVAKWNNTAQALVAIGGGMRDMDTLFRRQSQENLIKAYWETSEENRGDWAKVSKNIKGAAKFNPYNDDAYRRMQSMDFMRAGLVELMNTPDLEKMEQPKFIQLQQTTRDKMMTAFKEAHLSPKDYGDALFQWDESIKKLEENYVTKNAEYRFKQTQTKMASDMSFELASTLLENPNTDKTVAFKSVIDNKIAQMSELGWAADTQLGVLFASAKGFLAKNADMMSGAEFKAAVSDIVIDGQKASEIIPNYDVQVKELYKQALQDIYEDKSFAYKQHQLDLEISSQEAMKELYKWTKDNPNAGYAEVLQQTQAVVQKYKLEEVGFSFIKNMAGNKETLVEMLGVHSDPLTLQTLGAKAALGILTREEVEQAVSSKSLNWKEGLALADRIDKENKEELQGVKEKYKRLETNLKPKGLYGSALSSKDVEELQKASNSIATQMNKGEITHDEANKKFDDLDRIAIAKMNVKANKNKNEDLLLNATYIRSQKAIRYDKAEAEKALQDLGILRGAYGQPLKATITSGPNEARIVKGQINTHTNSYDVGATLQTSVHSLPKKGVVIRAGKLNDFGNFVIIRYEDGTYVRMGHLSTSTGHLLNKVIPEGGYIGKAGSSGMSTGVHLHVDFWNRNLESIPVTNLVQRGR